jgi:hypothetical protein
MRDTCCHSRVYLNDLSWIVERVMASLKVFLTAEATRAKFASKIL